MLNKAKKKQNNPAEKLIPLNIEIQWAVDRISIPITGIVGVTDVVAATYNIIYLLKHSKEFYIVRNNKAAFDALAKFPEAFLVGESTEPGLPFIATNSPRAIAKLNLKGKTVILKSNNGTSAVAEAMSRGAGLVFGFHWANISSVATWLTNNQELKTKYTENITLIASGGREEVFKHVNGHLLEDWYCSAALKDMLVGKPVHYDKYFQLTIKSIHDQYPPGDPIVENRNLVLQENTLSGFVPVFEEAGDGIFQVTNALSS